MRDEISHEESDTQLIDLLLSNKIFFINRKRLNLNLPFQDLQYFLLIM